MSNLSALTAELKADNDRSERIAELRSQAMWLEAHIEDAKRDDRNWRDLFWELVECGTELLSLGRAQLRDEYDGALWCNACRARVRSECKCEYDVMD